LFNMLDCCSRCRCISAPPACSSLPRRTMPLPRRLPQRRRAHARHQLAAHGVLPQLQTSTSATTMDDARPAAAPTATRPRCHQRAAINALSSTRCHQRAAINALPSTRCHQRAAINAQQRRKHVEQHVEQVVGDGVDAEDDHGHNGVEDSARRHHLVEQHEDEAGGNTLPPVGNGRGASPYGTSMDPLTSLVKRHDDSNGPNYRLSGARISR
jgi:hypothetical protein